MNFWDLYCFILSQAFLLKTPIIYFTSDETRLVVRPKILAVTHTRIGCKQDDCKAVTSTNIEHD